MPPNPSGEGAATPFLPVRVKLAILDRLDSKRSSCSEDHFLTSSSWNLRSGLGQAADDFPVCLGPAEVTEELQ